MIEIRGKIDENDLQYVRERFGEPLFAMPAPATWKSGQLIKINPHISRFLIKGKTIDIFHIKPVYYATPSEEWRPLYEVASYYGNKRGLILKEGWENKIDFGYLSWYMKRLNLIKGRGVRIGVEQGQGIKPLEIPLLLNTTSTFYPDPNVETTTCDGNVSVSAAVGWASNHDAATGTVDDSAIANYFIARFESGTTYTIYRQFWGFDTSSIPDTDVIDSATLSLYGRSTVDNADTVTAHIVPTTSTFTTSLATTDFNDFTVDGATDTYGSIAFASWNTAAYNDFTLNASGIANISKTGITRFGGRQSRDYGDSASHTLAPTGQNLASSFTADQAGTTNDPKLVVVHSAVTQISVSDSLTITESVTLTEINNINVNDAITISESITMTFVFAINVFDSLTLSESVTVENANLGGISVSDTLTITESVTMTNTELGGISVSDALTITENLSIVHVLPISVSDSIGISESITMSGQSFISVSDSITITESKTMFVPDFPSGIAYMRSKQNEYPLAMDDESLL